MPLLIGARFDEEFHLHLLKFAGSENEVSRRDFVAERLADLADAKGRLHARSTEHVCKVHEDSLRRLRAKVVKSGFVLDWAQIGFEKSVEQFWFGPSFLTTAIRAGDVGHGGRSSALLLFESLFKVVCAETLVAAGAFD